MRESDLKELIKNKVPEKRYIHTLSVAETAVEIAENILNNKQDFFLKKVKYAALLHDYAKGMEIGILRNMASLVKDEWNIDDEEWLIPQVLHAPISAHLSKYELGIDDPDVLEAIRYHTVGSPEMGIVAQVIFVADFIEPGRDFATADIVRATLNEKKCLENVIIDICNFIIRYNINHGRQIHPNTLLLRNAYLRRQA
ncbi:MAG: bis(5'-nucleosyl)-tetraphosphatase (symmetrical) YqeK [Halanaerobiaceae bacterium]